MSNSVSQRRDQRATWSISGLSDYLQKGSVKGRNLYLRVGSQSGQRKVSTAAFSAVEHSLGAAGHRAGSRSKSAAKNFINLMQHHVNCHWDLENEHVKDACRTIQDCINKAQDTNSAMENSKALREAVMTLERHGSKPDFRMHALRGLQSKTLYQKAMALAEEGRRKNAEEVNVRDEIAKGEAIFDEIDKMPPVMQRTKAVGPAIPRSLDLF